MDRYGGDEILVLLPETNAEGGEAVAKENLSNLKYTSQEIKKKRRKIYHQILTESEGFDQGNFERIETSDLERLFELYDLYFLDSFFHDNYMVRDPDGAYLDAKRNRYNKYYIPLHHLKRSEKKRKTD